MSRIAAGWTVLGRCTLAGLLAVAAARAHAPTAPLVVQRPPLSAGSPSPAAVRADGSSTPPGAPSGAQPDLPADGCRPDDFTAQELQDMETESAASRLGAGTPEARAAAASEAQGKADDLMLQSGRHLAAAADPRTRAAGWLLMGAEGAESLVAAALVTSDPVVYRWAQSVCGRPALLGRPADPPAACALLSSEQAARLDPDNGAVWLRLLDAANRRGDRLAADEALYRASKSTRFDTGDRALGAVAAAHRLQGASPMEQYAALLTAFGVEAAFSSPGLLAVQMACTGDALAAVERREACGAVGELMAGRGRALGDVGTGVKIARRARLDAPRLAAIEQRRDALYAAFNAEQQGPWDEPDASGCTGPGRLRAHALKAGDGGEVGVLEAWIAASGRSEAAWANDERGGAERRAMAERAASAAWDAATAASAPAPGDAAPPIQ